MKSIFWLVVSLLLVSSNIYSGTVDPHKEDRIYVKYAEQFPSVGKLCGTYSDGTQFCASAVAISDRWILTAAHVVKNANKCFISINGKKICVSKFTYKQEFDLDILCRNDIAVGYCEEDIGLANYPALYEQSNEINKKCDISGFGITGTFISGSIRSDDKKRAGTNTIDKIYNDTLVCTPSHRAESDYTDKEFIIASGDSGGGLFIDGKLAGINSLVMADDRSPNSSYTDESCHTRVSVFKEWIESIIK
jgi:secreted trypsin-like serine protease